jgi:hypothetical protein
VISLRKAKLARPQRPEVPSGYSAKDRKARTCRSCQKQFWATAAEHKEHASLCARAVKAGLVLPEAVVMLRAGQRVP